MPNIVFCIITIVAFFGHKWIFIIEDLYFKTMLISGLQSARLKIIFIHKPLPLYRMCPIGLRSRRARGIERIPRALVDGPSVPHASHVRKYIPWSKIPKSPRREGKFDCPKYGPSAQWEETSVRRTVGS